MTAPNGRDLDKMMHKIRQLLVKAEDPAATKEEAEAFTDKALDLMAKYGIEQAMLTAKDPSKDTLGDRSVTLPEPFARQKAFMLGRLAVPMRVKPIVLDAVNAQGQKVLKVRLFGYGADLERLEILFVSLLVQASYGLARERVPAGSHVAAFRRSWLDGFSAAVSGRVRQAEERAQAQEGKSSGSGMELVLVTRQDQVEKAFQSAYPQTKKLKSRLSGDGRVAGYRKGLEADLGQTRVGGNKTAIHS